MPYALVLASAAVVLGTLAVSPLPTDVRADALNVAGVCSLALANVADAERQSA